MIVCISLAEKERSSKCIYMYGDPLHEEHLDLSMALRCRFFFFFSLLIWFFGEFYSRYRSRLLAVPRGAVGAPMVLRTCLIVWEAEQHWLFTQNKEQLNALRLVEEEKKIVSGEVSLAGYAFLSLSLTLHLYNHYTRIQLTQLSGLSVYQSRPSRALFASLKRL